MAWLLGNPMSYATSLVGSRLRCGSLILVHLLCCLALARFVPWPAMTTIGAIVTFFPVWYLVALRRIVTRIDQRKSESQL